MAEFLLDAPDPPTTDRLRGEPTTTAGYRLRLAGSSADVLAVRRLRSDCFSAAPSGPAAHPVVDDGIDDLTDHLIVWHTDAGGRPEPVGTIRILPPHSNDAFPRGSGLLAHRAFGLMPLESRLGATIEVSGLCVAPGYRRGAVIGLLASGVARYLHLTGYRFVLGTVPVDVADGGRVAAAVWDMALPSALAPAERRCRPRHPVPIGRLDRAASPDALSPMTSAVPPLVRSALRGGARLCGPPGVDPITGSAVVLLMLEIESVHPSCRQRLLRGAG